MPIPGIFFLPLHYQSSMKTIFKETDLNPQLGMFTTPMMQLSNRPPRSIPTLMPVVDIVSLRMSANDQTEYQNLCKSATFLSGLS